AAWDYGAEQRLWLTSISQRVDVIARARQTDGVQMLDDRVDKGGLGHQRQQERGASRGIDCLGIGLPNVVVAARPVIAARYSDDRPVVGAVLFFAQFFCPTRIFDCFQFRSLILVLSSSFSYHRPLVVALLSSPRGTFPASLAAQEGKSRINGQEFECQS